MTSPTVRADFLCLAPADVRQRPVQDHVHRIIEIRTLREGLERFPFDALEIELLFPHF